MRKTVLVLGLLAAVATWPVAQAATVTYKATLGGAAEVPPVASGGKGTASVNVDSGTKQVSWRVEYSGLSGPAGAAHIHCGAAAGANGPPVVFFNKSGSGMKSLESPITGSATMTDAQLADLTAGKCYVNIHTAKNKGGEVRGQLAP